MSWQTTTPAVCILVQDISAQIGGGLLLDFPRQLS